MRVAPATTQPLPVYPSFPVIPAEATNAAGAWDARLHHLLEFDNGARALVTELLADGTVVAAPLSGDAENHLVHLVMMPVVGFARGYL